MPLLEAPLTGEVAIRSRSVDLPHEDPADRFIAATAAVYGLTLVTGDGRILDSKSLSLLPNR
jgi:PIN domain nuclease of toxin-antitoxin system